MQNEFIGGLVESNENKKQEKYFQNIENSNIVICSKKTFFNENSKEYTLKYKVKVKKDCNIYLASDYDLQVYIEGKPLFKNYSNIWSYETGIKQVKHLKENEELEFKVVTKQNLDLLYIYASNNEEIQNTLDSKKQNYFENVQINKNGLTGTAHFKDDGYLTFGIAYDKCWDVFVDGKKTEKEAIAGCFLGIKLKKGIHKVEIKASIFP